MTFHDELIARLRDGGHRVDDVCVRYDGKLPIEVDRVFMFVPDATAVARGWATVPEIEQRNAGKVFPESPYA